MEKSQSAKARELGRLPENQWIEAWNEVVSTAPNKNLTVSHVKKTVEEFQRRNLLEGKFQLGDWVKIQSSTKNGFDGQKGAISLIDKYQIGVTLDLEGHKPKIVRFYANELVKIDTPNDEINQQLWNDQYSGQNSDVNDFARTPPQFQPGDLVWITCPRNAEIEQRLLNRCWGIVEEVDVTVKVQVKGKIMNYLKGDLKIVNEDSSALKKIADKVNKLYQCKDLDELEVQLLAFFSTRSEFNEKQLDLLDYIWKKYSLVD